MSELSLFPLSAVLMPYGRMPLQIFEQRYIDLVRDCMKSDSEFGVVWIRQGGEIGELATSLDRMRFSIQSAMDRLRRR